MFEYINKNINYVPKIEDYLKFEDEQNGNSDSSVNSSLDNSLDDLKKEKDKKEGSINDNGTSDNDTGDTGTSSGDKQDDISEDPENGDSTSTDSGDNGNDGNFGSSESPDSSTDSSSGGSNGGSNEPPVEMQFSKQGIKFRRLTMFTELNKIYKSIRDTKLALENMKTSSDEIKSCVAQLQELENDTNVILKTFDAYTAEDALIHTQMIKERASIIIDMVKRATRHVENQNSYGV